MTKIIIVLLYSMPHLGRHHLTWPYEPENWNINICYATRVHDLPWYLSQITLFRIPVSSGEPNFQKFFYTFKKLDSAISFPFSHPYGRCKLNRFVTASR
jgi:hypothetical protein